MLRQPRFPANEKEKKKKKKKEEKKKKEKTFFDLTVGKFA